MMKRLNINIAPDLSPYTTSHAGSSICVFISSRSGRKNYVLYALCRFHIECFPALEEILAHSCITQPVWHTHMALLKLPIIISSVVHRAGCKGQKRFNHADMMWGVSILLILLYPCIIYLWVLGRGKGGDNETYDYRKLKGMHNDETDTTLQYKMFRPAWVKGNS